MEAIFLNIPEKINELKHTLPHFPEAPLKGMMSMSIRLMTAAVLFTAAVCLPFQPPRIYSDAEENLLLASAYSVETDKRTMQPIFLRESAAAFLAVLLLLRAAKAEPFLTGALRKAAGGVYSLCGLDNRLKSRRSLARKITDDAEEDNVSLKEAADGISDALRYTVVSDEKHYGSMVRDVLTSLQEQGVSILKFRNAWGGKFYQGINVKLETPDGMKAELQLHTPQSFDIKERSHIFYEIRRSTTATAKEIKQAVIDSIAINKLVRMPAGAMNITCPAV